MSSASSSSSPWAKTGGGLPGEVGQVKVIKDMPRMDEASLLLQKLHSLCKPIQKKYGWYLPTLTEFFPSNPNLLGMNQNRGETIFIRLRPADDKSSFLPLEESLVGTLLHEFTHNVHGPHHKQFYEFLDKLQDEYEVLRTSGYSGDGFFSDGRKAGSSRDLPPHLAREKGLQAAQRRQQINSIMGSAGGNRLGPGKSTLGKTPKQMAAESAERRASDDKTCGQGTNVSGVSVEEEMDKAKKENTTLVRPSSSSKPTAIASVVMTSGNDSVGADTDNSDDSDIEILVFAAAAASTSTNRQEPNKRSTAEASGITLDTGRPSKAMKRNPQSWICAACTFSNENLFGLACEVCGTERRSTEHDFPVNPATRTGWIPVLKEKPRAPVKISTMTWICHLCGAETEHQWWTCRLCGHMKSSSSSSGSQAS